MVVQSSVLRESTNFHAYAVYYILDAVEWQGINFIKVIYDVGYSSSHHR